LSRLNKYIFGGFILLLWVGCQSCFQFRSSDKKQLKVLSDIPKGYSVNIGYKLGGDRRIHYTLVSSDTALPLAVFIHGSPGSSSSFIHFGYDTALLKSYNVLLIDRPGFGYSDFGEAEESLEDQSRILREVLAQFSFKEKYLVGHSLGGPIICRMAMDAPDSVAGLLIVAGSVSAELEPSEKWRKPMSKKPLRWLMPKSFRVSNDEILPAKEELLKMVPLWSKINCPVQIIQGGKDNLVPAGNEDYAEKMLINAKSVRVYRLPEENHFIPFTQPQLLTEALLRF
jgi:pimeloyl-ACP methyl ester carboxylesterase